MFAILAQADSVAPNQAHALSVGEDAGAGDIDGNNEGVGFRKLSGYDVEAKFDGDGSAIRATTALTDQDWFIGIGVASDIGGAGEKGELWLNGGKEPGELTSGLVALSLKDGLVGARRWSDAAGAWVGKVAAAWILPSSAITDREKLEGYLGHWGTQTGDLLPAAHPYKSAPPTGSSPGAGLAPALLRGLDGVTRFNPPFLLNRIHQSNFYWNTDAGTGATAHETLVANGAINAQNMPVSLDGNGYLEISAMSYKDYAYDAGARFGNSDGSARAYVLKWNGTATFTVNASDGTLTPGTITANRYEFTYADPVTTPLADVFMRVRCTSVTVAPTELVLVPADQEAAYDAGQRWDADFRAQASFCRILRFMDTQKTNDGQWTTWAEANDTTQRTYDGEKFPVPLSWMVDLCNELKRDGYWCLKHELSDADQQTFVQFIHDNLDATRHAFFEGPGNEPWNATFDRVYNAMEREGVTLWQTGDRLAVGAVSGGTGNGPIAISGMAKTNPVQWTATGHGLATGNKVYVPENGPESPTKYNGGLYTVTVIDPNTISFDGQDGTLNADFADDGNVEFYPVGSFTSGGFTGDFIPHSFDGSGAQTSGVIVGVPQSGSSTVNGTFSLTGLPGGGTMQITIAKDADANFSDSAQIRHKYQAYRAAEMFDIVKTVYGVNFGVKGKTCFGIFGISTGRWSSFHRGGFAKYASDNALGSWSDLIDFIMTSTYCSTIREGNTTDDPMLLDWLADSAAANPADVYAQINNRQRLNTIDRSEETAWNLANAGTSAQSGTSVDEYEVAWAAWVAIAADPAGDASEAALRGGVGVYEGATHDTYAETGREATVRTWLTDVADGYIYSQAKADLIKYINQRAVANGVKFCADFAFMGTRDADKPWATKLHVGHVNPVDTAFKDQNGLGTTGGDKLDISWDAGRPDSAFV